MADSFNKKEREKKKRKRKQDKAERKKLKKEEGVKTEEFMYLDEDGNLTSTPPDPTKKKKEIKAEDIQLVPGRNNEPVDEGPLTGTVKFFNTEKNYGFIKSSTNVDYFVHGDNLIDQIKDNDKVTFELGKGNRGEIAINVKLNKD